MNERESAAAADMPTAEEEPIDIDRTVAHTARMYDYLLGGSTNFEVDRAAVDRATAAVGGLEVARAAALVGRAFLGRALRYLAGEANMRQFLDIGTGIPHSDGTHADPQQTAPDARVVYVDNDPIVLAHAHTLLRSTPEGEAAYVEGDVRDPDDILRQAEATLDLSRPVAVVCTSVLHLIPDDDDPYTAVARLVGALAPGSHLVVSHLTRELEPRAVGKLADRIVRASHSAFVARDRATIARFFDGLELVEPGLVPVEQWRPDSNGPAPEWTSSHYGGIGRKPAA